MPAFIICFMMSHKSYFRAPFSKILPFPQKRLTIASANRKDKETISEDRAMACTTILVGKNASYDGSTMVARNDDSGSGHFTAKKFVVVQPEEHRPFIGR